MSYIVNNSLIMSGFGDSAMKATDYAGVERTLVGPPTLSDSGGSYGIWSLPNGNYLHIGNYDFEVGPATEDIAREYSSIDFSVVTKYTNPSLGPVNSSAIDAAGRLYITIRVFTGGDFHHIIHRFPSGSGVVTFDATYDLGMEGSTDVPWSEGASWLAVNPNGTRAYYGPRFGSGGFSAARAWNLTGNVSLGEFIADDAAYNMSDNCAHCLSDGSLLIFVSNDVLRLYDTSGTITRTYTLANASTGRGATIGQANGTTDSFWVGYYTTTPEYWRFDHYNVASPTSLGGFNTPSSAFEWDAPFTLSPVGTPAPTPTVPPAPQVLTTQPCCGDSPSSSSTPGAGPVEEGTGWSPECNYGGTVPSAADIVDSESWAA